MKIFVTGATGQIGRRLVSDRLKRGDRLVLLSRDAGKAARLFGAESNRALTCVQGDPTVAGQWQRDIDGCDAVIHLAGAGIADRRWNPEYKKELVRSRIESTQTLVRAIEAAGVRPRVLINGSAIGYYDDAGDNEIAEQTPAGQSFLARMCVDWETQARQAGAFGARVVMLRLGIVLDECGGALKQMLLPFKLGLGGPLAGGRQWWPWIHWRDVNGIVETALGDHRIAGAINVVGPKPVRQQEFAKALGRALRRPAFMPMPKFALRLAMGEMSEYLLMSQRVTPKRAVEAGYRFEFPELEGALAELLK